MKTIWKFDFPVHGEEADVEMPHGAEVIHVGTQSRSRITVWAIVTLPAELEYRKFFVYGTGAPIDGDEELRYIGTVHDQGMVWHVFEPAIETFPGSQIATQLPVVKTANTEGGAA